MSLQEKLAQLKALETPVKILPVDLTAPFADTEINISGDILGAWLGPNAATEVWVRLNERSEPLIPFRQGMALEVPFRRVYLTNLAAVAPPLNIMYMVYGDANLLKIQNNASDPGAVLAGILATMVAMQNDTANIDTQLSEATTVVSTGGGFEVLTPGAAAAAGGANQACREAIIWTPNADVHFRVGAVAADATCPELPVDTPLPMPVANTNLLRFFNNGAAAATCNILWRN